MDTMLVATQADKETVQGLFPDAVLLTTRLGTVSFYQAMNAWRITEGLASLAVPTVLEFPIWNVYRMVDPDKNNLSYWAEDVWIILDGFEAV